MLTPLDHAFAVLLAVLFPIRAAFFGFARLQRASAEQLPTVRRSVYRSAMLTPWTLVAVGGALWAWEKRDWSALGLHLQKTAGLVGVLVGLALIVFLVARQRARGLSELETGETLRKRMAHVERMMPRTPREMRAFYAL